MVDISFFFMRESLLSHSVGVRGGDEILVNKNVAKLDEKSKGYVYESNFMTEWS